MNAHGAGAVRSDPKAGDPSVWAEGHGPQGDEVRILNHVRCVRGGAVRLRQQRTEVAAEPQPGPPGRPGQGPGTGRQGFVVRLDRDGDGKVSREEFDGPAHHFDHLDRDGDGYLGEDEAPPHPPPGGDPPPRR
jgi:hypothetical protein